MQQTIGLQPPVAIAPKGHLLRVFGMAFALAIVIGNTIGSGILRTPGWMLVPDADGAREPIGDRIIETSTDVARTELRDTRFGFVAYVPPGSIARGAVIASQGVGAAAACESCHGPGLRGVGNIPPLAGRSPTYLVRQLILFRFGGRAHAAAAPMRREASQLTLEDMIAVAALPHRGAHEAREDLT